MNFSQQSVKVGIIQISFSPLPFPVLLFLLFLFFLFLPFKRKDKIFPSVHTGNRRTGVLDTGFVDQGQCIHCSLCLRSASHMHSFPIVLLHERSCLVLVSFHLQPLIFFCLWNILQVESIEDEDALAIMPCGLISSL